MVKKGKSGPQVACRNFDFNVDPAEILILNMDLPNSKFGTCRKLSQRIYNVANSFSPKLKKLSSRRLRRNEIFVVPHRGNFLVGVVVGVGSGGLTLRLYTP